MNPYEIMQYTKQRVWALANKNAAIKHAFVNVPSHSGFVISICGQRMTQGDNLVWAQNQPKCVECSMVVQ